MRVRTPSASPAGRSKTTWIPAHHVPAEKQIPHALSDLLFSAPLRPPRFLIQPCACGNPKVRGAIHASPGSTASACPGQAAHASPANTVPPDSPAAGYSPVDHGGCGKRRPWRFCSRRCVWPALRTDPGDPGALRWCGAPIGPWLTGAMLLLYLLCPGAAGAAHRAAAGTTAEQQAAQRQSWARTGIARQHSG